jgi:hypothetical protein
LAEARGVLCKVRRVVCTVRSRAAILIWTERGSVNRSTRVKTNRYLAPFERCLNLGVLRLTEPRSKLRIAGPWIFREIFRILFLFWTKVLRQPPAYPPEWGDFFDPEVLAWF